MRPRAAWRRAWAAGASGSSSTSGRPSSAPTRSSSWSGTLPSSGTSSSSASSWPPPSPKIVKRSPVGVVKPRHVLDHAGDLQVVAQRGVGRALGHLLRGRLRGGHDHELRLRQQLRQRHRHVAGARAAGRSAGSRARPSPRPRGTGGSPCGASGPRQVIAWSSRSRGRTRSRCALTPPAPSSGMILRSADDRRPAVHAEHARDRVAPHVGVHGRGLLALGLQRAARLAVTVDLPTPPLPEPTQITFLTRASAPWGSGPAAEALLEGAASRRR